MFCDEKYDILRSDNTNTIKLQKDHFQCRPSSFLINFYLLLMQSTFFINSSILETF